MSASQVKWWADATIDELAKKGAVKIKKLYKKLVNVADEQNKELLNPNDKDDSYNKFVEIIESLKKESKLIDKDGNLALNKLVVTGTGNKRKRSDSVDSSSNQQQKAQKNVEEVDGSDGTTDKWEAMYPEMYRNGERYWKEGSLTYEYLSTNPQKITRLFCGNLNKKVTAEDLMSFLPGITHIKWITDKQSGEFYGSSFLEFRDASSAINAILQDKAKFLGRPLKVYYCPPRPGDNWPQEQHAVSSQYGNRDPSSLSKNKNGGSAGNNPAATGEREKNAKPPGCRKLFVGNLSYEIDDDTMVEFFKDCGALTGLRWLTHKDSGDFRGCGYVEFATSPEAEAAMKLDGMEILGRKIRIDWAT